MFTISIDFSCKYKNTTVEHSESSSVNNLTDVKNVTTTLLNNIIYEGMSSQSRSLRNFRRNRDSDKLKAPFRDPFRHRSIASQDLNVPSFIPASRFTPDRYSYRSRDSDRAFRYLPNLESNLESNLDRSIDIIGHKGFTLDLSNIPVDMLSTKMQDIANKYTHYKETISYMVPVIDTGNSEILYITLSILE
jgi:hypothetical protein